MFVTNRGGLLRLEATDMAYSGTVKRQVKKPVAQQTQVRGLEYSMAGSSFQEWHGGKMGSKVMEQGMQVGEPGGGVATTGTKHDGVKG